MEKIKSLLSGHSKDESKESREGSHFANTRDPSSSLGAKTEETGMGLPIADQYAGKAATTGALSGEASHLSGASGSTEATGTHATGLSSTSGSTVPNSGARDAAVAGSGVGAHERQTYPKDDITTGYPGMTQDSRQHGAGITSTGAQHGSGKELGGAAAAGVTPGLAGGAHEQRNFPLSSNATGTSTTTGTTSTTTTSTHHPGRDAAAIGGAAVVGESVHQHDKLSRDSASTDAIYQGTKGGTTETTGQPAISDVTTKGPHSTNTANLLDPNIKSGTGSENALNHSKVHGGGAEKADHDHKGDGTGSAAALKIGEAGTATVGGGVAAHEYNKHPTGTSATTGTTSTNRNMTTGTSSTQQHHYGRDAAVGAGVGGVATHEYNKHPTGTSKTTGTTSTDPNTTIGASSTQQHHYGRDAAVGAGVGGVAAHEYDKHHTGTSATTGTTSTNPNTTTGASSTQQHHYGRDAAVGTGVGGAAYEADKHIKHDKDLTQAEKDAKKQHKHDEKEAKKEHKEAEKEAKKEQKYEHEHNQKKSGGLLSFLHRDKSKKYSPEEEAEFDRQEREHNSHAGRNAALGAGAVGAGGAAAYEANKHHSGANTQYGGANTQYGGANTQYSGANTQHSEGNTEKQMGISSDGITHGTPLAEKPLGKDYGDHLHGARNRGVQGSSGFPGEAGFGDHESEESKAALSGVAGDGVTHGKPLNEKHQGGFSNPEYGSQSTQSHLGRDAVVGAGTGAVAGGVASHSHHKHDSGYRGGLTDRTANTTSGYQAGLPDRTTNTNTNTNTTHTSPAVAGYPDNKPQFGFGGDHTSSNTTGGTNYPFQDGGVSHSNSASGMGRIAEDQAGNNKLHQDSPAGHSSLGEARAPTSEDARETMIAEGKESMGRDTGVANPHKEY